MEGTGITPVMDLNRGCGYGCGDGMFGGNGIWLFAILALMWGGNGMFGNRGYGYQDGRCATVEDLNNSANFTRLENQVQGNGAAATQGFTNLYNGICDLGYKTQADFAALSKQIADCCCGMEKATLENRYLAAQNTAAINANTTAGIQKVLDKMCENEKAAMTARINQLELAQAVSGVVRYPNGMTYNAGNSPFCHNNGCFCG